MSPENPLEGKSPENLSGWISRHPALKQLSDEVLSLLSVWSTMQINLRMFQLMPGKEAIKHVYVCGNKFALKALLCVVVAACLHN